MDRQDFFNGMSQAASTVSVITTDGAYGKKGVTVSAMTSVSADPPSLLVCVHHLSKACEILQKNGVMAVNVLRDDQAFISDTFAGRLPAPNDDAFAIAEWDSAVTGAPLLRGAMVNFDCEIVKYFQSGSHFIFIGEVRDIRHQQHGQALVYANRAYGRAVGLDDFVKTPELDPHKPLLKIACYTTLGAFFMPRLIAQYRALYPDGQLKLFEGVQSELYHGLESGQYDAALMYDLGEQRHVKKTRLAEIAPHVLLPALHPLAHQAAISLHDLATEPMVLLDAEPSRSYFLSLFESEGIEPKIALRSKSFETVRGMVGNWLGYSLLTTKPANNMSYDGSALVSIPIKEPVEPSCIAYCTHADKAESEQNRAFKALCERFFLEGY
jgi:flavin reductase (DIM6/NTAB) family NADH-FMN oxidoreductase RutF